MVNCIRDYIGFTGSCIGILASPSPNTGFLTPNIISNTVEVRPNNVYYPPLEDFANTKLTIDIFAYTLWLRGYSWSLRGYLNVNTPSSWLTSIIFCRFSKETDVIYPVKMISIYHLSKPKKTILYDWRQLLDWRRLNIFHRN